MDPLASRQAYYESRGVSAKRARQRAKLDRYIEHYASQPRTLAEFVAATEGSDALPAITFPPGGPS